MASTKNPARYPATFFKMVEAHQSGKEVNITTTHPSPREAINFRAQWNAFRAALKHHSDDPRYDALYTSSLGLSTSLNHNTLTVYNRKNANADIFADIENQLPQAATAQPACAETDIATEMGMPSNAELESIRELRSKYKADIVKAIRLKFIPGICPMPADCPAPEDDPIAAFEYLAEQGIYLSDTAKAAHFELVSQREK